MEAMLKSMVSCQKGPTRHAYAWQIGPFWQDTFEVYTANEMQICTGVQYDKMLPHADVSFDSNPVTLGATLGVTHCGFPRKCSST